ALGPVSGLVRIDVEGREALEQLRHLAGGKLPPTWSFRSGRADKTGFGILWSIPEGVTFQTTAAAARGRRITLSSDRRSERLAAEPTHQRRPLRVAARPQPVAVPAGPGPGLGGRALRGHDWQPIVSEATPAAGPGGAAG